MKQSTGTGEWFGGLKDGNGMLSTGSGAIQDAPYSFATRFGEEKGTNPEELIATAHAACFSMAFSAQLGERGLKVERIATKATVTMDKTDNGFGIVSSHLDVQAKVPGATDELFQEAALAAKQGCPVSKVLKAEITMKAHLE